PVSVGAVEHYPTPNTNVGPFFRNNYFSVSPETNTVDGMIFKVDHSVGENHRIDFSTTFSNGFAGSSRIYPTIADPNTPDRRYRSRRASGGHTWTISPRTVNRLDLDAATSSTRYEGVVFPNYRFSHGS